MITISKQINLSSNSATSTNSTNSSCYFQLPNMMRKHNHVKYVTLTVSHCEIPVSWYIINNSNNKLVINLNGTGDVTHTLINGNYNANTFKVMLLNILGAGWNLTLNSSTGKYTLSYAIEFTEFVINGYTSTCYKLMGFLQNTYYNSESLSLTFPNPCNFLGTSRINIKSSTLKLDNLDTFSNGHSGNIISISNSAELYGIILYKNTTNFKNLIYNEFLNGININITDENNIPIDFNGIDWYITLEITEYIEPVEIPTETNLTNLMKDNI